MYSFKGATQLILKKMGKPLHGKEITRIAKVLGVGLEDLMK